MNGRRPVCSLVFTFAACGDNLGPPKHPDAGPRPDMKLIDADSFVAPTPLSLEMSDTGPDQIMSVAPGPGGTFYAAGYAADTPTGAKLVVVAKLTASGGFDTSFGGGDGFYTSSIEFQGNNDEIDVVVQSTGKIVVAATIANDANTSDRDIGLFRVDATGALDDDFGTAGFSRIDLSTAHDNGSLQAPDAQRGLALGPSDTLYLSAVSRDPSSDGSTPRIDTDFTIAKLDADGELVSSYGGGDGKFLLDFGGASAKINATPRGLHVLSDGSVIAGGYANTPASNNTTQAVLYRLDPTGALDPSFNSVGYWHEVVLATQTEVYHFGLDGNNITTGGYGRIADISTNCCNNWVSLRFNATTGARDTTFGGAPNGAVTVDPSGAMLGSNCRNAIGLPGGKTALIGSAGPAGGRDAAVAILTANGELDTAYGTGVHAFDLDGTEDQWWGGAVSGGKLLVAGWRGFAAGSQTEVANDDAHGILIDLK